MRILQLIDSLEAGGAERMAVNIANALSQDIEESFLCTTRSEGILKEFILAEVNYFFLKKRVILDFRAVLKLRSFIIKNGIDMIHAHSSSFFLAVLLKLTYPKIKIIWHDHYGNSELLEERKYIILKYMSFFFNTVIAVNNNLASWAKHKLLCNKVVFIPNFSEKVFSKESIVLEGEDNKRIVCLANLRPQKDHETLINAFKLVNEQFPDWTLHLVGKEFNDTYEKYLKRLVLDKGLEERAFFYGTTKNVHAILSKCDIGVLSSKSEGLPLALIEYGLNNLAVISTNVGECSKVIADVSNGMLIPPENPLKMSEAINQLIKNRSLREEKALNFNSHIKNNYSKTKFIEKLMKIYETA